MVVIIYMVNILTTRENIVLSFNSVMQTKLTLRSVYRGGIACAALRAQALNVPNCN